MKPLKRLDGAIRPRILPVFTSGLRGLSREYETFFGKRQMGLSEFDSQGRKAVKMSFNERNYVLFVGGR